MPTLDSSHELALEGSPGLFFRLANFDQQRFGIEFHFLEFTEPVPEFSQSAPAHGSLFADAVLALSLHVEFAFMGKQLDVQSRTNLLPWAANQLGLQLAQSAFRRSHQIVNGRLTVAHLCEDFLGGHTTIHHPGSLGLTVLGFDLFEEIPQRRLITGITSQYLIGQRKTLWCDNQCDDHLHAITSLVPTVPELALVCFSDRRITFEIGTGQIIEENVKLGVEEIFPALSQVSKERPFVLQEQVVAFVKSVAFG